MNPQNVSDKYQGNWFTFRVMEIETKDKSKYEYEYVTRTQLCSRGGVEVIPLLKKSGKLYLLLIKNFRYPINSFCIEFPGGMIDPGETIEEAAARELREETGYIMTKILTVEKDVCSDPWKSDDANNIVICLVDGDAEENLVTQNQLDHIEQIEPLIIEWDCLEEKIAELRKDHKVVSSVGYFIAFRKIYSFINNI